MKKLLMWLIIIITTLSMALLSTGCKATAAESTVAGATAAESTVAGATAAESTVAGATAAESTVAGATAASGKSVKVAFMSPEQTNDSSKRQWRQVQNEVEGRGWELVGTELEATYEADKTRTAFIRLMEKNPDAIVLAYTENQPIRDLILEAESKGVGVYVLGRALVPGLVVSIESSATTIAAQIANYAINMKTGSFKNVGFIDFWGAPSSQRRDLVAAVIFEKCGYDVGNTLHHSLTPEGYTDEIFSVTSQWLTKYGKDLDFVWVCWDLGGIVAAQAMAQAGFGIDEMFTVGIDGGSQAWSALREGKIPFAASLAEAFEYQSHMCFEMIQQVEVEGLTPGDGKCIVPSSHVLDTSNMTKIITSENVPSVGSPISQLFDNYGEDINDPNAWINWGEPYKVEAYAG